MAWLRVSEGSAARSARLMIGAGPGDRVLVAGAARAGLAADLGLVTGLNGRLLATDRDADARARVEAAAARAGALLEFVVADALREEPAAFDLVVADDAAAADGDLLARALRALRPAGRAIVLVDVQRTGPLGWKTRRPDATARIDAAIAALAAAGLVQARRLGEVEGTAYVEAVKPR